MIDYLKTGTKSPPAMDESRRRQFKMSDTANSNPGMIGRAPGWSGVETGEWACAVDEACELSQATMQETILVMEKHNSLSFMPATMFA